MAIRRTTAIVMGAGHAGLAMSRCLADRSIDHVVLERGEIANSWQRERWDSLCLLTPNWQSRLPGYCYQGDDPDGYMMAGDVVNFIQRYAQVVSAPVWTETEVTSVRRVSCGYSVITDQSEWQSKTVVMATGACNIPRVPAIAEAVPSSITNLTPMDYRNPGRLDQGGVLVVGASATGTQLAAEIQRSGRQVTIAVGEHVRAPRTYRGRDIKWWMDAAGVLNERYDEIDDIDRARRVPSLQLTGSRDRATLDLNALLALGVNFVGRLANIHQGKAQFSGSLRNNCALADLKMRRLLNTIDEWATENGLDDEVGAPDRPEPTEVEQSPRLEMNLEAEIRTIIWATGFRPDYSWLDVPVLDRKGRVQHDGGVVMDAPGMYLMGQQFLRRRKSALIDGAADDANDLSDHMASYLNGAIAPRLTESCYS